MSQVETIHVVSKTDNSQHAVVTVDVSTPSQNELPPSSVRVRPLVLSLSSNNLSYARAGHLLHWWDAYPVPSTAPAPYNDQPTWGIVPAWGYATVLESTTDIAPGSTLWGFWPTSSLPTELTLTAGHPSGHWIEVSEHRKQLMTLYNRYQEVTENDRDRMAWGSVFHGVWGAAYRLCEYVFSPGGRRPVHPLGDVAGLSWTAEDADLSAAVVISLAASTKTARSFTYNVLCRPDWTRPLGILQITSEPGALGRAKGGPEAVKALAYADVDQAVPWLTGLQPRKLVIVDFGARGDALVRLRKLIRYNAVLQCCQVVIIQVGSQQKVYTHQEMLDARTAMQALGKIQFNASGVQDTAIETEGAEMFFTRMNERWEHWLGDRTAAIPDMRLAWGKGVAGIEEGWERLTKGEVRPEEALVYMM
ncbi:hypothetical protein BBP40_001047 [Aspergillus hancockii]|nr:hypothetical protein BBP40_001047 [Aspergillus hancockii]